MKSIKKLILSIQVANVLLLYVNIVLKVSCTIIMVGDVGSENENFAMMSLQSLLQVAIFIF